VLHLQQAAVDKSAVQASRKGASVAAGQDMGLQIFPYTNPCVDCHVSCGVRIHMHMHMCITLQDAFWPVWLIPGQT
jgi:hypothetical protein